MNNIFNNRMMNNIYAHTAFIQVFQPFSAYEVAMLVRKSFRPFENRK